MRSANRTSSQNSDSALSTNEHRSSFRSRPLQHCGTQNRVGIIGYQICSIGHQCATREEDRRRIADTLSAGGAYQCIVIFNLLHGRFGGKWILQNGKVIQSRRSAKTEPGNWCFVCRMQSSGAPLLGVFWIFLHLKWLFACESKREVFLFLLNVRSVLRCICRHACLFPLTRFLHSWSHRDRSRCRHDRITGRKCDQMCYLF